MARFVVGLMAVMLVGCEVLGPEVERVERTHPELIGGAGVYRTCCGHGPFIHIDTRGYRARWTGSSGG